MLHEHEDIDDEEITSSGQSKVSAKKVSSFGPSFKESDFDTCLKDEDIDKSPFIINP